jgi:hypothetical protein
MLAFVWALAAASASAQVNPTARLSGLVTGDTQGLPGVLVSVESPTLQGTRTTTTTENGDCLFPSLPPGDYSLSFELSGMETAWRKVRLSAAQAT